MLFVDQDRRRWLTVERIAFRIDPFNPSKIEWDLTNGPLSKLLELLDTQVSFLKASPLSQSQKAFGPNIFALFLVRE